MSEAVPPPNGSEGEHLHAPVRRLRHQEERWAREGERPLGRNLSLIGALGWAIVLPLIGGLFLGRWIDDGHGVFWTISLMFAGLSAGCWMAWRRITEEQP